LKTFFFIFYFHSFIHSIQHLSMPSFTPVSPIRDFKGDTTINVLSTPAFCPTPAVNALKLEPIEPTQLFPPISIQPNSPSSLNFGTPDYKRHFSSYLEPTPPPAPSAPIPINDLKWMNMKDSSSSSSSSWSSSSCSCTLLSSSESDFSSSSFDSSSSSGLSTSESSESIQFKWSATP